MRRHAATVSVVALVVSLALGCGTRDPARLGTPDAPLVLLLGPAHASDGGDVQALAQGLSAHGGVAIDVITVSSARAAVTRAGTPRFDAAILPLFDYLYCHEQFRVQAGLQVVRGDGAVSYRGELVVPAGAPTQTLADLAGAPVAFVDRYSTSGFLFPAHLFAEAGVTPEARFVGSHASALEQVLAGEVAAAAVYAGQTRGGDRLRVIATTAEIPNEPVFFRAGLSASLRDALARALNGLAATADGKALLARFAGITGFRPTSDAHYREVHAAIQALGQEVEDLVPAGWRIRHEHERSLLADFAL